MNSMEAQKCLGPQFCCTLPTPLVPPKYRQEYGISPEHISQVGWLYWKRYRFFSIWNHQGGAGSTHPTICLHRGFRLNACAQEVMWKPSTKGIVHTKASVAAIFSSIPQENSTNSWNFPEDLWKVPWNSPQSIALTSEKACLWKGLHRISLLRLLQRL